ncbi:MAG: SDR family NAD(P)-dependent oxidoreductase [Sulfurimonadaceae bacterium]
MHIAFEGKKVLITGGTRGIGAEIAQAFLDAGAFVVVTATNALRPRELDVQIHYETLHITQDGVWRKRVEEISEKYDGFDICVNNAGINRVNKIYETQSQDIDDVLLLNLNAPLFIASIVSKKMKEKRYGHIINIASIFGVVSRSGRNPYTATKSGLIGATKSMALDLAEHNVFVNAISPGFVDTELTRRVLGEDGMREMLARVPLKKLAKVSDIAPMVLFLCSEYNSYITGQNIIIDGGFTLA